jgi:hypothetical protein
MSDFAMFLVFSGIVFAVAVFATYYADDEE